MTRLLRAMLPLALLLAIAGLPPPASAATLSLSNAFSDANGVITVQLGTSDLSMVGAFNADINATNTTSYVGVMVGDKENKSGTFMAGTFDKDLTQTSTEVATRATTLQNLNQVLGVTVASATHSSAQVLAGAMSIAELAPQTVVGNHNGISTFLPEVACRDVIVAVLIA